MTKYTKAKFDSAPYAPGELRAILAAEAAAVMLRSGRRDYGAAKRKAASRHHSIAHGELPGNQEIERALIEHQQMFGGDAYARRLAAITDQALELLELSAQFRPRVVGELLSGSVDENSPVILHVFTDAPEGVDDFLLALGLRIRPSERRVRYASGRTQHVACYQFATQDVAVEMLVFALNDEHESPLGNIDGKPVHRAGLRELQHLCAVRTSYEGH
ncbi:MAG: hypothetical protein ACI8PT_004127 [Gammaproteobacteria bacterium]|jgi:hypothetical protein